MEWLRRIWLAIKKLFSRKVVSADGRIWIEVAPKDLYPTAIHEIRLALKGERPGSTALANYLLMARRLPDEAWDLALNKTREECNAELRVFRAQALEIARLWWTERRHAELGFRPMGVHIIRDLRWRQ